MLVSVCVSVCVCVLSKLVHQIFSKYIMPVSFRQSWWLPLVIFTLISRPQSTLLERHHLIEIFPFCCSIDSYGNCLLFADLQIKDQEEENIDNCQQPLLDTVEKMDVVKSVLHDSSVRISPLTPSTTNEINGVVKHNGIKHADEEDQNNPDVPRDRYLIFYFPSFFREIVFFRKLFGLFK